MVLVRLQESPSNGKLVVIRETRTARKATVLAVGPEVRELTVGATAIVNSSAGATIGEDVLLPESAVLGTV